MPAPTEITPQQLSRLIGTPKCPILIDVFIDEDFTQDPHIIPGARRYPFDRIADLVPELLGRKLS